MISATKFQPHNISEVQTGLCSPKDLLSQISDQLWLIHPFSSIFTMRAVPSLWNRRRRRDMMMCLAKNQNTQMSPCRTWRILACLVLSLRMENLSMLTTSACFFERWGLAGWWPASPRSAISQSSNSGGTNLSRKESPVKSTEKPFDGEACSRTQYARLEWQTYGVPAYLWLDGLNPNKFLHFHVQDS